MGTPTVSLSIIVIDVLNTVSLFKKCIAENCSRFISTIFNKTYVCNYVNPRNLTESSVTKETSIILLDVSPFKELTNSKSYNRPYNDNDDRRDWHISDTEYS